MCAILSTATGQVISKLTHQHSNRQHLFVRIQKNFAMAFVLIFLAYHLFISDRNYVIITSLFRSEHALFGTWKHEASPPFLFYTWQGPEIELRDVLALGNAPYNILRPSLAFEWPFWIPIVNHLSDWP